MSDVRAKPSIKVIGLYSPSASKIEYERFIKSYLDRLNPVNFDEKTRAVFQNLGRGADLKPLRKERLEEIENELRQNLANAVFVEALVRNPDDQFDVADFSQPDPAVAEGLSQVAWNEVYLSEDGETALSHESMPRVPASPVFRIVFVLHFWKPHLPLASSYGKLECPPIAPLPARLWRLAPYDMPD
jgi:hypothetical protein